METKKLVQLVEQSLDKEEMDYHDDGYIELVLRMMGSMCDGQNTILQVGPSQVATEKSSVCIMKKNSAILSKTLHAHIHFWVYFKII